MGKSDSKPITNLPIAAKSKQGFSTALFLPDTRDILEACSAIELDHNERVNQVFLKEDTQKRDKVNTQILSARNIYHCSTIEGGCANVTSILSMLIEIDTTTMVENQIPFLHKAARRIALVTSSTPICHCQECYLDTTKAKLNYQVFSLLDKVFAHVAKSV